MGCADLVGLDCLAVFFVSFAALLAFFSRVEFGFGVVFVWEFGCFRICCLDGLFLVFRVYGDFTWASVFSTEFGLLVMIGLDWCLALDLAFDVWFGLLFGLGILIYAGG